MTEITADKIKRILQKLGLRISKARYCRFSYDRENFPKVSEPPTIFDIGANIGQSARWLKISFPESSIYSFEPVESVYRTLVSNCSSLAGVKTVRMGLGSSKQKVEIPRVHSATTQVVQVLANQNLSGEDLEGIEISTVDAFCAENSIDSIQIIKTDTEGFDLDVCKGAESMLSREKITYIVSEVSLDKRDTRHTNFLELRDYLSEFGYEATQFFDVSHEPHYFNVLFEKI